MVVEGLPRWAIDFGGEKINVRVRACDERFDNQSGAIETLRLLVIATPPSDLDLLSKATGNGCDVGVPRVRMYKHMRLVDVNEVVDSGMGMAELVFQASS